MPTINVLDEKVSRLIAAGEVVERPASVVKELVENAIDSGADKITIEIENGGNTFIRVSDNGCGIARCDVRKAFLRHATSKVKTEEDLNEIFTMGFRGEALASIVAVSKLTLITKTKDELTGSKYVSHGAKEVSFEEIGCADGTSIIIENLFFNVPARMKFLKKDITEGNAIANIVDKLALSNPNISFSFIRNSKEVFNTYGNGKIKSAIYSIYGKGFSEDLIEVNYKLNDITLSGFISKPFKARANRSMQVFFINSRYIKSQIISVALERAYKGTILTGKFPVAFLYLDIDSRKIDINVHPTKTEVRFEDEKQIFECVYYGVKSSLEKDRSKDEIELLEPKKVENKIQNVDNTKFTTQSSKKTESIAENSYSKRIFSDNETISEKQEDDKFFDVAEAEPELFIPKKTSIAQDYKAHREAKPLAFRDVDTGAFSPLKKVAPEKNTVPTKDKSLFFSEEEKTVTQQTIDNVKKDGSEYKFIGEAFATYIIIQKQDEILFIDKHAAHERLIYEKLKKTSTNRFVQTLLVPQKIVLDKEEYGIVIDNKELFFEAGFELSNFGDGIILLRSMPAIFSSSDAEIVFLSAVEALLSNDSKLYTNDLDNIYHSMACKSAIKANDINSDDELIKLALKVENEDNIKYCPHGRPISIVLKKKEIEKKFKRS